MASPTQNRLPARASAFHRPSSPRPLALNHGRHVAFSIRETNGGGEGTPFESERGISYTTAETAHVDRAIPQEVAESNTIQAVLNHSPLKGEIENRARPPISLKETISAGRALKIEEAVQKLRYAAAMNLSEWNMYKSGIVRIEAELPCKGTALNWLKHQTVLTQRHISFYFRQRDESTYDLQQEDDRDSPVFCGIGHSWLWKGMEGAHPDQRLFEHINRFMDPQNPSIKCVGATRFDCDRPIDEEWKDFGSYLFFIPAVEFLESPGHNTLACTVAWDATHFSSQTSFHGLGMSTPVEAVEIIAEILQDVLPDTSYTTLVPHVQRMAETHMPSLDEWKKLISVTCDNLKTIKHAGDLSGGIDSETAVRECLESGQQGLDDLLTTLNAPNTVVEEEGEEGETDAEEILAKIVLARQTKLDITGTLSPHAILQHLQHCDPNAYQFCLGLPTGGTFVGSTPERLYIRNGDQVISEAVAGTRPRGPKGNLREDFSIGLELMRHPKDHIEFTLVRDWLTDTLRTICSDVDVDVRKSVIRRASVQHLYGRLRGRLKKSHSDFDILKALHPTPAVCGRPQTAAKEALAEMETFDRGYYAGPFGWLSGQGAEFVVAIRSSLFKEKAKDEHTLSLFAGVGTVKDSDAMSEWKELDLKIQPFKRLLSSRLSYLLASSANIRMASLLVEELCRSGIHTFGVAPGSRSSPLVYAAATNPNCHVYSCIDERSLGFWSLGYARATHRPAPIITSSGTATGNLMPSVIEASLSRIPMLLLTADRPSHLRRTGANQTIDQVKMFGDYTRYFHDIPPPSESNNPSISRAFLTTVDAAVRHACMDPAGPAHLNFQFDEPLAPIQQTVEQKIPNDRILENWLTSDQCFTKATSGTCTVQNGQQFLDQVQEAKRGLLIIGELLMPMDQTAAAEIAELLRWPCIVDVLSGLKNPCHNTKGPYIHRADQILSMDLSGWESLMPDVILQFSGHLTSKRLMQFLQHCRETHPQIKWIQVSSDTWRDDPCHLVTEKLIASLPQIHRLLKNRDWESQMDNDMYLSQWTFADQSVARSLVQSLTTLSHKEFMTEPYASFRLSQLLPADHGLFLGNGMPVRDMEMFGGVLSKRDVSHKRAAFSKVAANRGASGIDGVVSAAIGYAVGLRKPVTLLIGDISFLHDSNGLNFLRNEAWPPMTLVVINNGGGGIFDFLPIARAVEPEIFDALWSTPQNVNIATLCQAYGVAHNLVTKPAEFEKALHAAWKSYRHCVVEVVTDRKSNVALHQQIQAISSSAALRAVNLCNTMTRTKTAVIKDLSWHLFSLPLKKPLTTGSATRFREGILLRITLKGNADSSDAIHTDNGVHERSGEWSGLGEISPLDGRHSESLQDVLPQLRYLRSALIGQEVPREICLLDGHLSDWLSDTYGIEDTDLSPTVRFGFDTALLMAFACMQGHPLHKLWSPYPGEEPKVSSNALLDDISNEKTAIERCHDLLEQGYQTIKIKVGRGPSPKQEAKVVSSIARTFGDRLSIRLDANQAWDIHQALCFAEHLSCPTLEYIEEPVKTVSDMTVFCEKTQLPVALDESIALYRDPTEVADLLKLCPGVVSCILKPSCVGSVDRLVQMMKTCVSLNSKTVISSAFESPVGISFLCELAAISNNITQQRNGTQRHPESHGLGTVDWFQNMTGDCFRSPCILLEASWQMLLSQSKIFKSESDPIEEMELKKTVSTKNGEYIFHYHEVKNSVEDPMVLFLHGFLGNSNDWLPIMHYLSNKFKCVAVDLPGHGDTLVHPRDAHFDADMYDFEHVSAALCAFANQFGRKPHAIVGYSLGGRLAQHMALHMDCPKLIVISGTSGIENPIDRAARLQQDIETAGVLTSSLSYERFLRRWYEGSALWTQLRQRHPMYLHLLQRRQRGARPEELAKALVGMSTGKMEPLIRLLRASMTDVLYVFGQKDAKFCGLMESLDRQWSNRFAFLPFSFRGHGLIVESGLRLGTTISGFL